MKKVTLKTAEKAMSLLEEMAEISDLRTKKANELRNLLIEKVKLFEKLLEKSRYKKYEILTLDYYDYSKNESSNGDERLRMIWDEDKGIYFENQEYTYEKNPDGVWLEQGSYFNIKENWEENITNIRAYKKAKTLMVEINKLIEDEKKYIEETDKKIEMLEEIK